jgi:hypothetical protein
MGFLCKAHHSLVAPGNTTQHFRTQNNNKNAPKYGKHGAALTDQKIQILISHVYESGRTSGDTARTIIKCIKS